MGIVSISVYTYEAGYTLQYKPLNQSYRAGQSVSMTTYCPWASYWYKWMKIKAISRKNFLTKWQIAGFAKHDFWLITYLGDYIFLKSPGHQSS